MRELLPLLQGPARYAGMEDGICVKESPTLRIALAFPDKYEVGMSYLGHKILYGIVNEREGWQAERVFAPDVDAAALLRKRGLPLCTLESDTPLGRVQAVGFAVTNELSFTNVLYMLDMGQIPLRQKDRPQDLASCPVIVIGGGAALGAEALAPFADLMCLGDGEESLPEVLEVLEKCLGEGLGRDEFLQRAARLPGIYVPSFFMEGKNGLEPRFAWHARPGRRVVEDLDKVPYPTRQVVPVGAVHERLALEIARGCSRGCRFCHAGMVYRPVRERSVDNLARILDECLDRTGFEETSFLSLSTGDFSALGALYEKTLDRCAREQISLSLPSLRVGSVDNEIMASMARLRRTGCTIAPEAGSQRLRDVINKGVNEEELIRHVQGLLAYGWRNVKLYFMIGLPTETDEDLAAIVDLCRKVREAGGPGAPKMAVTAALSPFVPKPFTPFQWEGQIGVDEMQRRINYVRTLAKTCKGLKVHWHEPAMSHLEGLLSRAGRDMADVVEKAWRKGAIFCAWMEHFDIAPWREALAECGIRAEDLIAAREPGSVLPWSHLEGGVSEEFLLRERGRALRAKTTADCRYGPCRQCGVCHTKGMKSRLPGHGKEVFRPRLNFDSRDQHGQQAAPPIARKQEKPGLDAALKTRVTTYCVSHTKLDGSCWLSQLELAATIGRALRRAKIPVAFSQGFHPMPRISFGRALPVGLESENECFLLGLCREMPADKVREKLNRFLPRGMEVKAVQAVAGKKAVKDADREEFALYLPNELRSGAARKFEEFMAQNSHIAEKEGKRGLREIDIRGCLESFEPVEQGINFVADWRRDYVSPFFLLQHVLGPLYQNDETRQNIRLVKIGRFAN